MSSFDERYRSAAAEALAQRPANPQPNVTEADLAPLPAPVRRYVLASGALGRPVPRSMRLEFGARMFRTPGGRAMHATAEQTSTFDRVSRSFLMRARMHGLPVRALHLYRDDEATFQVRIASLLNIVDMHGDPISSAETVTVLNDLCVFAPGRLADPRLAWTPIDDASASVVLRNGRWRVSATLRFEGDDLVDFWSDDRPEAEGGRVVPRRWSTPLADYRDMGGVRVATRGQAVYQRPDGPFAYGEFEVHGIAWE